MFPRSLKLFYAGLFALVALLFCLPLLSLLLRVFGQGRQLSLLVDPATLKALLFTIRVALVSLGFSLLLTIPCAYLLTRTDLPGRQFFRRVLIFPYFIPPYLFAIAWIMLAVPRIGILNNLGVDWLNIYSFTGLCWVLSSAYFPVLLSSLCLTLDGMDPSLEEAGRICGASPLRTFLRICLPCLYPTLAAASVLFGLELMSAFGIPALIGNPARLYVLTTKIYSHAKMGGLTGTNEAFTLSLWLLALTLGSLGLTEVIRRRFQYRLTVGKVPKRSVVPLGKYRLPFACAVGAMTFLLVILPLTAIGVSAFLRIAGRLSFDNFGLDNFQYLFQMDELGRALWNSIYLALGTAVFCLVLGFFVSYFKDRTRFQGRDVLLRIASLPFAIPGTVIALALIISFGAGWGIPELALLGSPFLLFIAYSMKYGAIAVQTLVPALSAIDVSLDEAGRISGASVWKTQRRILIPLLYPALGSVFLLTALPVFSELTMSVLLSGPGLETIGTLLFQLQDYANPLAACALSTLLVVALIILFPLGRKLGFGRKVT